MVDFEKIKIIKKLGTGMFGTTYLAEYENKSYALKIQHILEEDNKKDFKNEMWRELDLYSYIEKLDKNEQIFFTRLYGYEIFNKCKHIQKRPFKVNVNNPFGKRLIKLDESDWCVKYLLDYKGDTTLSKFLKKNKPTQKQILSIMLQICKIIFILNQGGYSHNDLHPGNIMVNKTTKKYFNFMGWKIPHEGIQISAIDFGEVLHKKFKINYSGHLSLFLSNKKKFMFNEMFYNCGLVIDNFDKLMHDCDKLNKKLPWEKNEHIYDHVVKSIYQNHQDFFNVTKYKYLNKFPQAEKIFEKAMGKAKSKKTLDDIVKSLTKNREVIDDFWSVINRISWEFQLYFSKQYSKYWTWCSHYENKLPRDIVLELFLKNNYEDFVEFLIMSIEN